MKKITLSFIFTFIIVCVQAQHLYVDKNAVGLNNGSSWADAYTDLNTAITNSPAGELWVAQGTYYPGASGVNASTFTMKNGVSILGGFNGTEVAANQRDPVFYPTILSGDLDQSGTLNANDAYHVVTTANTNQTAVLDGFTITGGNANAGGAANSGGGILCAPSAGGGVFDPKFINCIITGNRAIQDGGGVVINSVLQASVTVGPRFYNCKFYNNQATSAGAAISSFIFQSNTSTQIENCLFYNNTAGTNGNDIYITAQSTSGCNVNITGCTFATDGANNEIMFNPDGGMSGTGLDFNNSIWYGLQFSSPVVCDGSNNCGDLTLITGANNFNIDPLYKNPATFDFSLSCTSPCINAGENSYINVSTGIDGGPRIQQTTVDIGAYESNYSPLFITASATLYSLCSGDFTMLMGLGADSYVWTGGVIDGMFFSPTITDTYTVTGTDVNGCVATETVTITVNPLPIVAAGSTDNLICNGDPVTLNGTGAMSYGWSGGVSDGIAFNPSVTDTYTVTGTDANGCFNTDMITVTVENTAGFSAGSDYDICSNSSGFLMNGFDGGFPAIWSTAGDGTYDDPNLISGSIYTFGSSDLASSTVALILTITPAACPVAVDTMFITRHDAPTASTAGTIDLCSNVANANINGTAANAGSVLWTSTGTGNFSSPTTTNTFYGPSAAEVAAGYARLAFRVNPNNPYCGYTEDSLIIFIRSAPNPTVWSSYNVCQGDSFLLGFNSPGGTPPFTYQWTNSVPTVISTANTDYITPTATESYTYTVTDVFGCTGSYFTTLNYDASENINGLVNVGAAPVTNGTVYLIKYVPQTMLFDTVATYDISTTPGSYSFPAAQRGTYLIKVFPDTLLYPNLLPTYYGDQFQWDSAMVINHNCASAFTANVNMIQLLGGTGSGTVSGFILEDQGFGTRIGIGHDHICVPGGPLKGVDVKLGKNPGGGIQARTMSDSTGFYEFTNLPDDTYRIYVDIPGLPMDSFYIVTVTADSTINQNYYADSNSVFPILPAPVSLHEYASSISAMSLYPNPAKNYTSVVFESDKENTATIRVLDITGKQLMNIGLRNLPKGKHEYQLNFTDQQLQSGIYFVELDTEKGKSVKKLVVE